ncbi:putative ribonuclease H-like domain-containing protein [Tanacetum coccineum]
MVKESASSALVVLGKGKWARLRGLLDPGTNGYVYLILISIDQEKDVNVNSTNNLNAASTNEVNDVGGKTSIELPDDPNMLALEDISIFDLLIDNEDVSAEADMNNLDTTIQVSPIPTIRIYKDHPLNQVIGDLQLATQTRNMSKNLEEYGFEEPKKVIHTLKDPSWIEAMQEELLQFKNKKDERGIMIRNKARLVAQGYIQEEGTDYDEVYAPVAIIEAIRLFLAYASFKDFVVYQMDVKSTFLYRKIEEEVYVCQPPGFEDLNFPDRVYKVEKALYGLHQAPRACDILLVQVYVDDIIFGSTNKRLCIAFEKLMHKKFQMSSIGELTFFLGLQVQQKKDGIFISQDKYVGEILKKFRFTEVKTTSTPMETQNPLLKDEDGKEVDVHMYRSMIGSLMYLTSSRPDIMFAVCLWYPKYSPFDLVAYTDSDYVGASLDKKSITGEKAKKNVRLIMEKLVIKENRQRFLVSKRIERNGINLLLLLEVNDAGHNLLLLLKVNAARHNLLLLLKVNAARHKLTTAVDGKKIIITELIKRRDLQLEDAGGVDCLPNATIFEQLTLMGSKTTAWNEFSSTMASAIICLARNQKFNFSKYIFESMVKNLDNVSGNFFMYPRSRRSKRKDTNVPQPGGPTTKVADEAVNKEIDDSLKRAATTATGLDAEQYRGNIDKTQSKPNCLGFDQLEHNG